METPSTRAARSDDRARDAAASTPLLAGRFAASPLAAELGRECLRLGLRYVNEVVAEFKLCPFLKDSESGLGCFAVVVDDALDARAAAELVAGAPSSVVHVVFPLARVASAPFERFASAIGRELKTLFPRPPVSATFHPELVGDRDDPHRLIGLLRRAPDPFVQFIPEGLQGGGTILAGTETGAETDHPRERFARLRGPSVERLLAQIEDIHADRARSYARFEGAFTQPTG